MYYDIEKTKENIYDIVSNKLKETFLLLASAIFLTIITVLLVSTNPYIVINSMFLIIIAQFALVMYMSFAMYKLSKLTLIVLFYAYSILTGLTLSLVILFYTISSVIYVLGGTLILFLTLAIYGFVTKKDLSSYSSFLTSSIIAILIISLINIFIGSNLVNTALSVFSVFVFMIYTAYDVNQIKNRMYIVASNEDKSILEKVSIIGAFSLYLDFINLFIYLLRLFGKEEK